MDTTVKEQISKLKLPKYERIDSYFYVNREYSEVEYNGLITPIIKDGLTNVEFYKLFLEAHAKTYFNFNDEIGRNFFHRIKDEYNFYPDRDLTANDIETYEFDKAKVDYLVHLMATRFIDNRNVLFIDVTKLTQFLAGQIFITFNLIKYLDEFFKEDDLTRVYKHYSNIYFLNSGA